MEAVDESSVQATTDVVKVNVVGDGASVDSAEVDLCHKSNGVAESVEAENSDSGAVVAPVTEIIDDAGPLTDSITIYNESGDIDSSTAADTVASFAPEVEALTAMETAAAVENLLDDTNPSKATEEIIEEVIENSERVLCHENEVTIEESLVEIDNVDTCNDKVTFKTEILVEANDNGVNRDLNDSSYEEHDHANNILSELSQGIELSEVLRSSDTAESVENNNSGRQEVFNKEELLDILEGNDAATSDHKIKEILQSSDPDSKKILEAEIALKQLTRLRNTNKSRKRSSLDNKRKRSKSLEKLPRKKKGNKNTGLVVSDPAQNTNSFIVNSDTTEQCDSTTETNTIVDENNETVQTKKNESIVNVLVKDWDDDEPSEMEESNKLLLDSKNLADTCNQLVDQLVKSQQAAGSQEDKVNRMSTDSPSCDGQVASTCKSGDENQPQRRLGRVIKKKVIFDPDNPDTFTKGKLINKNKESTHTEKEQLPIKKSKIDQSTQRAKSKSPLSKMSWKKPPPKNNSKQNKRLTEVDKLLMDEGAVNMIYQLTPEAPKGKKNMKTKAEFIKKIQSSTPDGKEMKFRERKKEARSEEEAKKILAGKQRTSLSSSVKSPSVYEDFENHSADDSIIYRRHSSSSYSSTCMSPRRLSDVDPGAVQSASRASRHASVTQNQTFENSSTEHLADVFMADVSNNSSTEIINKDDCLSIKEKLNTKLSLALNKRKRDNVKTDKSFKQKKITKTVEKKADVKCEMVDNSFKYISVTLDERLAEICILRTESGAISVEVLKELEQALVFVNNRKDISVTLLTSECGTLCSDLDLRLLMDVNVEKRRQHACEIAESLRSLLWCVERHSKLVVSGVWGACSGVALALVALSDIPLASESASFALGTPLLPAVAALTARSVPLPQSLVNEIVVLERNISAVEALQGGLVCRVLWPDRAADQVLTIARDIASQPVQNILLKKKLLTLKKSDDSENTFLSSLERERDLLVHYWTSDEGQEQLRMTFNTA